MIVLKVRIFEHENFGMISLCYTRTLPYKFILHSPQFTPPKNLIDAQIHSSVYFYPKTLERWGQRYISGDPTGYRGGEKNKSNAHEVEDDFCRWKEEAFVKWSWHMNMKIDTWKHFPPLWALPVLEGLEVRGRKKDTNVKSYIKWNWRNDMSQSIWVRWASRRESALKLE